MRVVVKVFRLLGSAYVSPRRPSTVLGRAHTTPTKPLIWSCLLLISRLFGLCQTRLPHVLRWTKPHNFCRVPHHGASLPPKRSGTKNCDLNSLPPSLAAKVLCLSLVLFCLSVLAPVHLISLYKIFIVVIVAFINLASSLHCVCFVRCL